MRAELARIDVSAIPLRASIADGDAGCDRRRRRDRVRPRRHAARHDPRPRGVGQRAARGARATPAAEGRRSARWSARASRTSCSARSRGRPACRPTRSTTPNSTTRSRATRRITRRSSGATRWRFRGCARASRACARWAFRSRSSPTRRRASCARISAHAGIEHYFRVVIGGDDLPTKKPDPGPLLHAARCSACAPQRLLMVGDSVNDVARGARRRLPGAGAPLWLQRGRAGAKPRRRWYSRLAGGGRRPRPVRCLRHSMSFDIFDCTGPHRRDTRGGGARRTGAAGADRTRAAAPPARRTAQFPAVARSFRTAPSPALKRSSKHHDRSRIPRACRARI